MAAFLCGKAGVCPDHSRFVCFLKEKSQKRKEPDEKFLAMVKGSK
jgi:hypothetical protein